MRPIWLTVAMIFGGLSLLSGALLGGWLFFGQAWADPAGSRESMLHDLFGIAVTIGFVGGATMIFDERRRQSDGRQARRERLEGFLREFTQAYNDIKRVRRELRSAFEPCDSGAYLVDRERYQALLGELNRGQLQLEQFGRILGSKPTYLSFFGITGIALLEKAESYLNDVIKEYEDRCLATYDGNVSKLVVDPGAAVLQFAAHRTNPYFSGAVDANLFEPLSDVFACLDRNIEGED